MARALLFPIVFAAIMCELKHLGTSNPESSNVDGAIAGQPTLVMDLGVAIKTSSASRLSFVLNGKLDNGDVMPLEYIH